MRHFLLCAFCSSFYSLIYDNYIHIYLVYFLVYLSVKIRKQKKKIGNPLKEEVWDKGYLIYTCNTDVSKQRSKDEQ